MHHVLASDALVVPVLLPGYFERSHYSLLLPDDSDDSRSENQSLVALNHAKNSSDWRVCGLITV